MNDRTAHIHDLRNKVAMLVVEDTVYMPIFLRLEQELRDSSEHDDALARARALAAKSQRAIG
ncbi:hypothetical protein KO516_02980 [Citreicella sp. C3M06]|uniref:hypothetical protein n=1 Tax=Citreicella sp. C3M06 TaxID=2841564 RepID=UPI001C0A5EA5|nr:hypothetical protein [Citreicella sp. C3M06]MBU2959805.1 hypothetical protein [Citreicella sp. C3M06]